MRLLLIGAFPFPYPQGSQVFAAGQASALARAGAAVAIASYGSGEGTPPAGVEQLRSTRRFAPRQRRSGPSLAKPLADAALVATVVRAQRARPHDRFDLALAHNAEAALVASAARRLTGLRYVYVAHTLLARELSAYADVRHREWIGWIDRLGARLDRFIARDADGVIALSRAAEAALAPHARGPVERIPPGLEPREPPSESQRHAACKALGLEPGRFFLYAGNLDGYQELGRLAATARQLARLHDAAPPVVVVTHDASGAAAYPPLRIVEAQFEAARSLAFDAAALLLTRTRTGGFPIKLLNYMETGRPIVASEQVADGLVDGETARLLPADAPPESLAKALQELVCQPERALRIGAAARRHLQATHDWPQLAAQTLRFLKSVFRSGLRR